MGQPCETLLEFSADWTPIFGDPGRRYQYLAEMESWAPLPGGAQFLARSDEGQQVRLRILFITPAIVRLQAWLEREPPETSPMLVRGAQRRARARVTEDEEWVYIDSRALRLRLRRRPWALTIADRRGCRLFHTRPDQRSLLGTLVLPTGFSRDDEGRIAFHEAFSLEGDEHLYGLGSQFGPFDKRGQRIVSWNRDPYGAMVSTVSYLNIPFFLSSRGYGVFVHHSSKIIYELGQPLPLSAAFRVEDPYLDYFFLYGPTPRQLIGRYGELTGRPPPPPLWSFGVWFSRCMYRDRLQVEGIAERLRELGIPADVMHLDPRWLKECQARSRDGCDFVWDLGAFPDPEDFLAGLAQRGFRLALWENPYVWKDTALYREGTDKGYFVRSQGGGLARPQENRQDAAIVDFTNPEAQRWWQDQHRPYLRLGVSSFTTDYGEGVPKDALFADGRTGAEVHNIYPLLYNRAVWEVIAAERGEAIVFGRSGYAGSQRYPIVWTGDAPCTWAGMAATLRAGLSLSLSGISMWSHDVAGFWNPDNLNPPEPILYIRWAQWALLSSHTRFHGVRGREPWYYGAKAVEVVREFARLRYHLLPYLWSLAQEAAATGLPLVRPLWLEYPGDAIAQSVDFEYLLGPYLLVVPVLNEEGKARIYLPPGDWFSWWTGERISGPCVLERRVPIERLPLFVRSDSILPLAPAMDYVGQRPWEPLMLDVRLASEVRTAFWDPKQKVKLAAVRDGDRVRLSLNGPPHRYEVRVFEPWQVGEARLAGDARLTVWRPPGRRRPALLRLTAEGPCEVVLAIGQSGQEK